MESNPGWIWTGQYSERKDGVFGSKLTFSKFNFPDESDCHDTKLIALCDLTVQNPYIAKISAKKWCENNLPWKFTGNFMKLAYQDGTVI